MAQKREEKLYTESEMLRAVEKAHREGALTRSPYGACFALADFMIKELFELVDNNAEKVLREVIASDLFELYKQKRESVRVAGRTAEERRKTLEKLFKKS